jgi:hypothetical protein
VPGSTRERVTGPRQLIESDLDLGTQWGNTIRRVVPSLFPLAGLVVAFRLPGDDVHPVVHVDEGDERHERGELILIVVFRRGLPGLVGQPPRFSMSEASERARRSHASWTASCASTTDPSIRYAAAWRWPPVLLEAVGQPLGFSHRSHPFGPGVIALTPER